MTISLLRSKLSDATQLVESTREDLLRAEKRLDRERSKTVKQLEGASNAAIRSAPMAQAASVDDPPGGGGGGERIVKREVGTPGVDSDADMKDATKVCCLGAL